MKKKTEQTFNVYLPANWVTDLNKALEINPPKFKTKYKYDYFIYIGQLPHYLMWSQDELETCATDYLPINSRLLQDRVHDYKEYIQYLMDNNLLESDNHYLPSSKSTGFRYPLKYAHEKPKRAVLTKPSLVKSLKKRFNKGENAQDGTPSGTPTYDYLTKWFLDGKLECDITKAEEILVQLREEELKAGVDSKGEWIGGNKVKRRTGKRRNQQKSDPQTRYLKRYSTALRIHDASFDTIGADTTTGRFHSPMVRLKKPLRPTVTYDGKRLVSVDIKNSQPVLMLGLLNPKVLTYNSTFIHSVFHFNPDLEAYLMSKSHTYRVNSTYKGINTSSNVPVSEILYEYEEGGRGTGDIMLVDFITERFYAPDVQEYIYLVTSGTFYENFGDDIAPYLDIKKYGTKREATKKITYKILFGSANNHSGAYKVYKQRFPTMVEIMNLIKHGDSESRTYRTLSCALQVFEADIVLNHCCRIISDERPDLPIFTVHDSIVTLQGEEEYVKSVMERTISKMIGYTPKLECQNW